MSSDRWLEIISSIHQGKVDKTSLWKREKESSIICWIYFVYSDNLECEHFLTINQSLPFNVHKFPSSIHTALFFQRRNTFLLMKRKLQSADKQSTVKQAKRKKLLFQQEWSNRSYNVRQLQLNHRPEFNNSNHQLTVSFQSK